MKNTLAIMIATTSLLCVRVAAQDSTLFPKGEIGKNTNNYTGTIWLNELNHPDTTINISLAQAVYAPGSKLDWHIHPGGQYLIITEGEGYYQERGKPVQIVRKGEVVSSLPGIEHWHGAAPDKSMAYLGVTPTQKGRTIWKTRVSDAEYKAIQVKSAAIQTNTNSEEEIISLSKKKWRWMSEKKVDTLATLFHDKAVFVHMGGSWGKDREIEVIKNGGIWYKRADVYSASVNIIGNTAILLNDIDLLAVVGGNEVINPFMVTEVYIKENNQWKMGSLTFSRLMRPIKTGNNQPQQEK